MLHELKQRHDEYLLQAKLAFLVISGYSNGYLLKQLKEPAKKRRGFSNGTTLNLKIDVA